MNNSIRISVQYVDGEGKEFAYSLATDVLQLKHGIEPMKRLRRDLDLIVYNLSCEVPELKEHLYGA